MARHESKRPDSTQARKSSRLPAKLDKSLLAYAVAASAAGVSFLAMSQPAAAEVIITQKTIVVPINGGVIQFDVNGDGIPDFGLSATSHVSSCCGANPKAAPPLGGIAVGHLRCTPEQAGNGVGVLGAIGITPLAAALPAGVTIGAGRHFVETKILMAGIIVTGCGGSSQAYGNWKGTHPPHAYLPVKFTDTAGNLHYGWVRIASTETGAIRFNATIEAYAYETVPNKSIVTGPPTAESSSIAPSDALGNKGPASLGMLALGASGLAAWRKQDQEPAA